MNVNCQEKASLIGAKKSELNDKAWNVNINLILVLSGKHTPQSEKNTNTSDVHTLKNNMFSLTY